MMGAGSRRTHSARAWVKAALLVGGCLLAAWLGSRAGRYFQFAPQDFRPPPPPHTYVSGPTYRDAGTSLRGRGT